MHPEKASGPDGMTSLLYQDFWDTVKKDLTCMVNQFLFEGTIAHEINDTNICLISKTTKPNEMTKFEGTMVQGLMYMF